MIKVNLFSALLFFLVVPISYQFDYPAQEYAFRVAVYVIYVFTLFDWKNLILNEEVYLDSKNKKINFFERLFFLLALTFLPVFISFVFLLMSNLTIVSTKFTFQYIYLLIFVPIIIYSGWIIVSKSLKAPDIFSFERFINKKVDDSISMRRILLLIVNLLLTSLSLYLIFHQIIVQ